MTPDEKAAMASQFMLDHFAKPEVARDYCLAELVVHFANGGEWRGVDAAVENLTPKGRQEEMDWVWPPETIVDDCFATEDRVAMRFHILFRHKKTGAVVIRRELGIFRLEGNRIAEIWVYFDDLSESKEREAAAAGLRDSG